MNVKLIGILTFLVIFGLVFWGCDDGGGGNLISEYTPGLAFALINDGTAYSVSKGIATGSVITIPAIYEGLPVTTIADSGFSGYSGLTSIILPIGISRIGSHAFFYCNNLTSIMIPTSVTSIGNFAFDGCSSLETVFYRGAAIINWAAISIGSSNTPLIEADRFYYSQTAPDTVNTHWFFMDGVPTVWSLAVTFNSNGGSVFAAQIINFNGTVTRPANPKRTGFVFDNWYSDEGLITVYDFLTPVTSDITLFAKWNQWNGIEMVQISAGTYTRGDSSYRPPHQVTLTSGFYMGKYEVTQEQYMAVMRVNPSSFSSNPAAGETQARRPVERVTWFDAVEFCNKLSEVEGLTPVYTITGRKPDAGYPITSATVTANWNANGYRLPTEAEWEYACRAGSTTLWHFGDDQNQLVNYAWFSSNSNSMTHEVGKKLPNAWGLYDMHGNVNEWCCDWYADYSSEAQTDPRGPVSGTFRVVRGGSWYLSAGFTLSAHRSSHSLDVRYSNLGFRVVRL